ncbi:MAG: tRNA lysidine(34) synthetase TilS [Methyloprofundus sp.]|nr:tRNA lysidine(34) synthetase TilS [Methyloprofundus sp.]
MKLSSFDLSHFLKTYPTAQQIFVGYSGGVDSHVLLHLLANSLTPKKQITAVYVHHGLQDCADDWQLHCAKTADALGVQFLAIQVDGQVKKGESPEESARNARYQAFEKLITHNALLLFAQHRQDQVETVLLQLFRGAGLKGLSGMPESIRIGAGCLLRPFLDVSQDEINHYAKQHKLHWVEDPSNQDSAYDRNYLRNEILPLVTERWKSVDKAISRSAEHCAQAQQLLSEQAKADMLLLLDKPTLSLDIAALLLQDKIQQQWIIREWMVYLDLRMPSMKFLECLMSDVLQARVDANPIAQYEGCSFRRYQNRLYVVLNAAKPMPNTEMIWQDIQQDMSLTDHSTLRLIASEKGIASQHFEGALVQIKYRAGGEKITLAKRTGRHSLKKLYQEAKIPPWKRENIPLIYIDGKIAAIADLWISAEFYSQAPESCLIVAWQ